MTTAIAPTPFPTSAAGQWACTIEDGRRPRNVTMRRYLVDEHAVVFRADGWTYRVDAIEVSDQGDVYITLIRRTRKGHDYKNRLGISTSLADLATSPSTAPRHLAGIVARLQATVAALAPTRAGRCVFCNDDITTDKVDLLCEGRTATDGPHLLADEARTAEQVRDEAELENRYRDAVAPVTVPMPQAGEGECPDCLAVR